MAFLHEGAPCGMKSLRSDTLTMRVTGVRITVFSSAIVIDVIVHCHAAGALCESNGREHLSLRTEVYENWVNRLNLNKKNFTALEPKKFNDEINSFFMDSYCSKIWNYVKFIFKVSMKWKN